MIQVISGTNRPGSRSRVLSDLIANLYRTEGEACEVLDLCELPWAELNGSYYDQPKPESLRSQIEKVNRADGLVLVVAEYNGSFPGALKHFIDHWEYPKSFEFRPVSFVGLGGRFGGLRAVEHLQQVFGYRNAFIYPERLFIQNIWNVLKEDGLEDALVNELLLKQVKGFASFIRALRVEKLDCNSRQASPEKG